MKEAQAVDHDQPLEFGKMTDRMAAKAAAAEAIETGQEDEQIDDDQCWARTADRHLKAVDIDQWITNAPEFAQRSQDRLRLMAELAELMREAWDEVGLDLINATNALPHMADRYAWRKAAGLEALDKEDATAARKWSRERHAIEPSMDLGITKVSPRNIMASYDRVRAKGDVKPKSRSNYGSFEIIPHEYDTGEVAWAHRTDIDLILKEVAKASIPTEGHRVPDEGLQVALLQAALEKAQERHRMGRLWADDGADPEQEPAHLRRAQEWRERHAAQRKRV